MIPVGLLVAIGLVAIRLVAIGLVAIWLVTIGLVAVGLVAVGLVAVGLVAIGLISITGLAFESDLWVQDRDVRVFGAIHHPIGSGDRHCQTRESER